MDTVESLKRRFVDIAKHHASKMKFSSGCERIVFRRLEYAAHRIASEGLLANQAKIKKAEANIERFISEMIVQAEGRGYGSMHEENFDDTMKKLHDLWPIC